jgi:hypothetical protein
MVNSVLHTVTYNDIDIFYYLYISTCSLNNIIYLLILYVIFIIYAVIYVYNAGPYCELVCN